MFGWKKPTPAKNESAAQPQPGEPLISALLLEGEKFPFASFQKHAASSQIGGQSPTEFKLDPGDILTFEVGFELFALALMPAPYPWSDLEGPCETSWMWPKETPAKSVTRHRTHLLITQIGGDSDPVLRRLMLTQVTAMAAEQSGVLGVYWPEATMVHYPPVFVKMAKAVTSREAPPLYLWVDIRVFRNDDGTFGMFTTGMKSIGHMEIEIPRISMSPKELRDWTINIAYYLHEKGPILKDGQTIGMTAEQQIRIRHSPSMFGKDEIVLRMLP